jgi:hemerythrin
MLIEQNEIPIVDMDFMNETHKEDVEIINSIFNEILHYENNANNAEKIDELYKHWIAHTVIHFETEEQKMQKLRFPPYYAHKGEHDRALQEMRNVFSSWQEQRNIQALKIYFIETVPAWFDMHVSTMDTVTATFFASGESPCSAGVC